jgi:hypothetical protein
MKAHKAIELTCINLNAIQADNERVRGKLYIYSMYCLLYTACYPQHWKQLGAHLLRTATLLPLPVHFVILLL